VTKNILITGARGLLGSSLCPYLESCGYNVIQLSRKTDSSLQIELTDRKQVIKVLSKFSPDVIINLAALTDVDASENDPQLAYMLNVRIVENIVSWIRNNKESCHLVQISTDQVYDGNGPHKETDINITNYYGFSKYAGELAAASVLSTVLRTNFFGASECESRTSLSDWMVRSLQNNCKITVFDDVLFSPLSIKKLTELIELVIVKAIPGIFNLGSKHGLSKAEFALLLAKTLKLHTSSMVVGASDKAKLKTYRPKDMRMDSSYFENKFNVELPTLKEEIESIKSDYNNEIK